MKKQTNSDIIKINFYIEHVKLKFHLKSASASASASVLASIIRDGA